MAVEQVRSSYGLRADEYTELLGSVDAMAAEDRRVIAEWAATVKGRDEHRRRTRPPELVKFSVQDLLIDF